MNWKHHCKKNDCADGSSCEACCYMKANYTKSLHNFLQAHINMILWFFNRNKINSSISLVGF